GDEDIAESGDKADECRQHRRADQVRRANVALRAPVLPHPSAILLSARGLIEILPSPKVEQSRRIIGKTGRRSSLRGSFDKTEKAGLLQENAPFGRVDWQGARLASLAYRYGGKI